MSSNFTYPPIPVLKSFQLKSASEYLITQWQAGWGIVVSRDQIYTIKTGRSIINWPVFQRNPFPFEQRFQTFLCAWYSNQGGISHQLIHANVFIHDILLEGVPLERRLEVLKSFEFKPPYHRLDYWERLSWSEVNLDLKESLKASRGLFLKEKGSEYPLGKNHALQVPYWIRVQTLDRRLLHRRSKEIT